MTGSDNPGQAGIAFQPDHDLIRWRMYFHSPPGAVYEALATADGPAQFWTESGAGRQGTDVEMTCRGVPDADPAGSPSSWR